MLRYLILAVIILVAVGLPVVMVRGLVQAYRNKDRMGAGGSGLAGVMAEIDRVVRPSIEYRLEVDEAAEMDEDDIGGD